MSEECVEGCLGGVRMVSGGVFVVGKCLGGVWRLSGGVWREIGGPGGVWGLSGGSWKGCEGCPVGVSGVGRWVWWV